MKKVLIYILIILSVLIIGLTSYCNDLYRQNETYKSNQSALLSKAEYYQTENSKYAASVQKLTLSRDEFKQYYSDACKTIEELNIKLKRANSIATTSTKTEIKIVTVVKDSIVYRDGKLDSLLIFRWSDPWVQANGNIRRDSVELDICSADTLLQVVHRVPHKFWFIKWGTKAIKQEVVSSNPHTKIVYNEYVELK